MTKVIGVRFRPAGKIYFFAPGKLKIKTGDKVIVETARGVEYGSVVVGEKEVEDDKITLPLKPVIRIATEEDKKKGRKEPCERKRSILDLSGKDPQARIGNETYRCRVYI